MTKHFCDRCEKEAKEDNLTSLQIDYWRKGWTEEVFLPFATVTNPHDGTEHQRPQQKLCSNCAYEIINKIKEIK